MNTNMAVADSTSVLEVRKELTRGRMQWRVFRSTMGGTAVVAGIAGLVSWHFPESIGIIIIMCAIHARHLAKIHGVDPAEDERTAVYRGLFFVTLFAWVVVDTGSMEEMSTVQGIVLFLFALVGLLGHRLFVSYTGYSRLRRLWHLSRWSWVTTAELDAMRAGNDSGSRQMYRLPVFSDTDPDLKQAWDAKSVDRITKLLQDGDARTRSSSATAIGIMNEIGERIDKARGNLSRVIARSDNYLRPYRIANDNVTPGRSLILTGNPLSLVTRKTLPRQVNVGRGLNQAVMNTYQTAPSWQAGAANIGAAIAVTVVAHYILRSRSLRKLADLQGKLSAQAAAVQGEIAHCRLIVATQMLPQFDALVECAKTLEDHVAALRAADPDGAAVAAPPQVAFQLRMALHEARRLLEMKAGDG